MTTEQNKLADRIAEQIEGLSRSHECAVRLRMSVIEADRIVAALRAAGEPIGYVSAITLDALRDNPGEGRGFVVGIPAYDTVIPLYAAQPAPSASAREALDGAIDTLHTLANVITEKPTWEGVEKSIGATDEEDDRVSEIYYTRMTYWKIGQDLKPQLAALSSTPSPLMAAGEAGGQDLMDRAAHILNQATGGPEGWSQWDEAVMNVVREAADRLAAFSSQPSRIDAAARASETVEATSPIDDVPSCGQENDQRHASPIMAAALQAEITRLRAQLAEATSPAKRDCAARVMGEPTRDQINAAAEVIWNDRDARHGGSWSSVDPNLIAAHQTIATARAALIAAANVAAAAEPARDMGVSVDPVENESDQVRCGPMGEDDWKDQRIASLEAYIAQLKDQQAMAEPTREEIAAALRKALTENWKDAETLRSWSEDILLTGCRRAGGIGYEKPMEAAQNLALDAADAILALKPRGGTTREETIEECAKVAEGTAPIARGHFFYARRQQTAKIAAALRALSKPRGEPAREGGKPPCACLRPDGDPLGNCEECTPPTTALEPAKQE